MSLSYDENHFFNVIPNIYGNECLREPQIQGYYHTYEHFIINNKSSHAVIVLPTGVGKTGLMALLPYNICKGRALIIAPQITIKDTVVDALNPEIADNFWLKRGVIEQTKDLPTLVEFESNITKREVLEVANIVVLNAQKLQSRLYSSPLNFLPDDFFDMIIIDEAHHSTAKTWVETVQYFSKAKVIKVTGTPFRTDGVEIAGELIYKYKLSQAMANGYVKSLENITYIPEELYLTVDNDINKTYTVEEIYQNDIKDEDWVKRSVAYSLECSEKVVKESLKLLERKLSNENTVPHKIIAVACSIEHAEQIKLLYEKMGYETAIIHSKLPESEKTRVKNDIKNNRVKVVVHVSMLGEGYDHQYLSVAAIFRPFKTELPYAQFIGRILRVIPEDESKRTDDNIGQIVSHEHLGLRKLWKYYKVEIQESEIIKHLKDMDILEDDPSNNGDSSANYNNDIGIAKESGSGRLSSDAYLDTELIKRKKIEDEERERKVIEIQNILKINREEAERIINQTQGNRSDIKRPDKYFSSKKKDIDDRIKQDIVPKLISKFKINQKGNDLKDCVLFRNRKFTWIARRNIDNGGMLATYFINYLNNEIGYKKDFWTIDDYEIAFDKLPSVVEYVVKVLSDYYN